MANRYGEEVRIKQVLQDFEPDIKSFLDERKLRGESLSDVLSRLLGIAPAQARFNELQEFLKSPRFLALTTLTKRYLNVLGFLYRQDPGLFAEHVLPITKGERVYFARSRKEIERSGTSTQPRTIPGTPFWALTNMSKER